MNYNEAEFLERVFGTYKIGCCGSCNLNGQDTSSQGIIHLDAHKGRLACGCTVCKMITELNIRKLQQSSNSALSRKLSKLSLLGFKSESAGDWILMQDNSGMVYWFNGKTQAFGSKLYKTVVAFGDILICSTGEFEPVIDKSTNKAVDSVLKNIELFSISQGNRDLLDGVDNREEIFITRSSFNNLQWSSFSRLHCHALLGCVDKQSGNKLSMLVNHKGNILLMPYSENVFIQIYDEDGFIITNDKNVTLVVTNNDFTQIKTKGIAFKYR